jgi:hypothetical protein
MKKEWYDTLAVLKKYPAIVTLDLLTHDSCEVTRSDLVYLRNNLISRFYGESLRR